MKITSLFLILGSALVGANPADDYVNFIRQIQKDSGVEWDVTVPSEGQAFSPAGVTIEGAFFELWSVHNQTAEEYLLDEQFVSAYLPGSAITIHTADPYKPIPRTRVDQPFKVVINVRGLIHNNASVQGLLNQVANATSETLPAELALDPEVLKTLQELQAAAEKANKEKTEAEADMAEAKSKADAKIADIEAQYTKDTTEAQTKYAEDLAKLEADYDQKFANAEADYIKAMSDAQSKYTEDSGKALAERTELLAKADAESDPTTAQEKRDKANQEYAEKTANIQAEFTKKTTEEQTDYDELFAKLQNELADKRSSLDADLAKKLAEAEAQFLKDSTNAEEDLADAIEKGNKKIRGIEVSFSEKYGDDAAAIGAGDDSRIMEMDAGRVFFSHEVQNYAEGTHSLDDGATTKRPIQEAFITENGPTILEYNITNLKADDLTLAEGEEVFTVMSLAGYQIAGTVLDSKRVQIWPIARAAIWGYDPSVRYDSLPPVKIDLVELYPASTTYLRVYPGPPAAAPADMRRIPDSYVILDDSVPQDRGLILKDLDDFLDKDGLYTLEIMHETPFGTDLLAQKPLQVDRTIEMKGSLYTSQ